MLLPKRGFMTPLTSGQWPPVNSWNGAVAQLGERVVRNDEVRGSIPLSSTIIYLAANCFALATNYAT